MADKISDNMLSKKDIENNELILSNFRSETQKISEISEKNLIHLKLGSAASQNVTSSIEKSKERSQSKNKKLPVLRKYTYGKNIYHIKFICRAK